MQMRRRAVLRAQLAASLGARGEISALSTASPPGPSQTWQPLRDWIISIFAFSFMYSRRMKRLRYRPRIETVVTARGPAWWFVEGSVGGGGRGLMKGLTLMKHNELPGIRHGLYVCALFVSAHTYNHITCARRYARLVLQATSLTRCEYILFMYTLHVSGKCLQTSPAQSISP